MQKDITFTFLKSNWKIEHGYETTKITSEEQSEWAQLKGMCVTQRN